MREGMEQDIANPRESLFWMGDSPDQAPLLVRLIESSCACHDSRSSRPRHHCRLVKLNENSLPSDFQGRHPTGQLPCDRGTSIRRNLPKLSEVTRGLDAGEAEQCAYFPQPFDKDNL